RRRQVHQSPSQPQQQPLQRQAPQQQPVGQQPAPDAVVEEPAAAAPAPKNVRRQAKPPHRRSSQPPAVNYDQARKKQHHERHDRTWWASRYTTIVFVHNCGYYYLDAGYWFPAFGYDPGNENFDYNGPIYTYGNLLPDQVIYNVQSALK